MKKEDKLRKRYPILPVKLGDYKIKDSGKRSKFKTGAVRDSQTNKGRFDLLPPRALKDLAIHYEKGCLKYGDRNWEKGQPLSRYLDSGLRHAFEFLEGKIDEDHLIAAIWNLMCLRETLRRIEEGILPKELNDLPNLKLSIKDKI